MSQWRDPPSVVVLSGSDEFLRQRQLREAVSISDEVGRSVEYVSGSDKDGLIATLSSTGVLFDDTALVVIEDDLDQLDADVILRHHERGSTAVCVVLHQVGAIKAKSPLAKIAAELPPRWVAKFEKPKPWDEVPHAVAFCASEARRLSLSLSSTLAEVLVAHVGTDLGMLAFELWKLRVLLGSEGVDEVTSAHVRSTLGAFAEIGPKPVVDALEMRDVRALVPALANLRRTHASDVGSAVLKTCGFVGHSATTWLHVAALSREGRSPEEISERVGMHVFVLRKNALPAARRWGAGRLVHLVKSLVRVSRAVKGGHVNPWVELECALLRSLADVVA